MNQGVAQPGLESGFPFLISVPPPPPFYLKQDDKLDEEIKRWPNLSFLSFLVKENFKHRSRIVNSHVV